MDPAGKLIYTKNHDVLSSNLQTLSDDSPLTDGTRIPLSSKEIGTTEVFATSLVHSPNGRFITAVGDGEYIIYTALAWRNKAFGSGSAFAWAGDSNTYAVLEAKSKVKLYKSFKERPIPAMKGAGSFNIEGLYGGTLLSARGQGFVLFWDWETGDIVRRIDVEAKSASICFHFFAVSLLRVIRRLSGLARALLLRSSPTTRTTSSGSTATRTMRRLTQVRISVTRALKRHLTWLLRSPTGTLHQQSFIHIILTTDVSQSVSRQQNGLATASSTPPARIGSTTSSVPRRTPSPTLTRRCIFSGTSPHTTACMSQTRR